MVVVMYKIYFLFLKSFQHTFLDEGVCHTSYIQPLTNISSSSQGNLSFSDAFLDNQPIANNFHRRN